MTRRRRPKATEQNDGTRPNVSHDPLRHWSVDVDPAVMSGDQWVDEDHDFGHTAIENKEMEKGHVPGARFMHPMHDTSYRKD